MNTQTQTQTGTPSYPSTPTQAPTQPSTPVHPSTPTQAPTQPSTPVHPPTPTESWTQPQSQVSAYCLDHVSDGELHLGTRRLVGRSNQILAALLAHLGEIEARGIHRERCCASLHTYLVYELRMSEDAAFRRARAARLCRE